MNREQTARPVGGAAMGAGSVCFALVGLLALATVALAGFDSLVLMLEFRRLAEFPILAAVPLWLLAWQLHRALARPDAAAPAARPWQALALALLAPGMMLLLYAVAAQALAPLQAPTYEQLLRAALLPALLAAVVAGVLGGKLRWSAVRSRLTLVGGWQGTPALGLLVLLYAGWLPAQALAALLVGWLVVQTALIQRRLRLTELSVLAVQGTTAGGLTLLVFWLALVGASFAHDLLPVQALAAVAPVVLLVVMAASGWWLGRLLKNELCAMAILAAPAVVMGNAAGVDPVWMGLVLSSAIALGGWLGRDRPSRAASGGC